VSNKTPRGRRAEALAHAKHRIECAEKVILGTTVWSPIRQDYMHAADQALARLR
jgi:hypothetical protein